MFPVPRLLRYPLLRYPTRLHRRARRARTLTLILVLGIVSAVLLPFYIIYKPPALLIRYFAYRWPDVLWQVSIPNPNPTTTTTTNANANTHAKVVALTIDDAPSPHTDAIKQVLSANDVTATFFVIGAHVAAAAAAGREETLRDLVRAGHELANHAMRDEPSRALPDAVLVEQLRAVQDMLDDAYRAAAATAATAAGDGEVGTTLSAPPPPPSPPRYFRPGSGFFSERMRRLLSGLGYRLVLGSVYPHDAQIPYWRVNARHILSMVRPGAIIVCHDRSWTVPMLRRVLPELRRRGYRVVTVTQLLKEAGHMIS